jgi:hypothetical protein
VLLASAVAKSGSYAVRKVAGAGSERGATMPNHRFRIGQNVNYRPASRSQDAPRGAYEITGRLPQGGDGQFEYRIKHASESHERIAKERELSVA